MNTIKMLVDLFLFKYDEKSMDVVILYLSSFLLYVFVIAIIFNLYILFFI